jgi:flagellar biosynthesis protein FlhB
VSDSSEKPFEATPARIRKARREGNVARSSELAANLSFAASAGTLVAVLPAIAAAASTAIAAATTARISSSTLLVLGLAMIPVGAAALAGMLGSLVQSGGFSPVPIALRPERLNPIEGIKRILSRETLAHCARAALAFTCASIAMAPFVVQGAAIFMRAPATAGAAAQAWSAAQRVAFAACAIGCCFAVAEYGAARRAWLHRLRMSFDERKRESKEEEGDAAARGRRRALHRSFLRGGVRRLRDAAFVVVNPHHVAIALEYRPPRVPVPRVLVRAKDAAAAVVRATATRYGIPVVENGWLARALYRDARDGEPIPHALYVAVAEVVAALLRSKSLEER